MPWLRWLLTAFALIFPVLLATYLMRDRPLAQAVSEALAWGGISAWVYVAARVNAVRRGRRCALCEDPSRVGE
ncbi:hypothetical protein LF41_1059 [Lysobacter dokdonensis DS-58]|uniref:Uncharacterized protein n=1 Tax=Lysobacter dokdonensis DS-58 TaxID=1300345 RepID=A0A0A2WP58_9GAMM|nr:hypothetical protein [Lysobacter dokdonensis]KGQ20522.1 hypothetical protein LF41_1059 [Lysobacter dokdonensis DS-58]